MSRLALQGAPSCRRSCAPQLTPSLPSSPTPPPQAQGAERTVLRHQASTWELLHVLFSAIEGEQAPGAAEGPAAMQEGEDGDELRLDRLAAFKRRAALRCVLLMAWAAGWCK